MPFLGPPPPIEVTAKTMFATDLLDFGINEPVTATDFTFLGIDFRVTDTDFNFLN